MKRKKAKFKIDASLLVYDILIVNYDTLVNLCYNQNHIFWFLSVMSKRFIHALTFIPKK